LSAGGAKNSTSAGGAKNSTSAISAQWRLLVKELRHHRRSLLAVIWILILGFTGPIGVSAIRGSVDNFLHRQSKEMLSADLSISSLIAFSSQDLEKIRGQLKPLKMVSETEFVTMAKVGSASSLIEIKAEDPDAPVYGRFVFMDQHSRNSAQDLNESPIAWGDPDVFTQLNARVGDEVEIGQRKFQLAEQLKEGPGTSQLTFGVAPRLYVGQKFIQASGLTVFNGQIYHRLFFQFQPTQDPDEAVDQLRKIITDPELNFRTPDDAVQMLSRFFQFFNLYLVVTTLIVFALAWVSAFYILQIYLKERLASTAILLTLGAGRGFISVLYTAQVTLLLLAGCLIASAGVAGLCSLVNFFFHNQLPMGFALHLDLLDFVKFAGIAFLSGVAFCVPLYQQLGTFSINELLSEDSLKVARRESAIRITLTFVLRYSPLLLTFIGLAATLLDSKLDAVKLMLSMFGVAMIGLGAGRLIFRISHRWVRKTPGLLRLVTASVARSRFGTDVGFVCLVLVALVMNLVPHLLHSLNHEFQPLERGQFPALFLVNIQESGLNEIESFIKTEGGQLSFASPLVQARLTSVNGVEPENDRLKRFPVRITYREHPSESETIIEGHEFSSAFDPKVAGAVPGVSLEERFAESNDFHLGDLMSFDVQGVPITAKVSSIRKIRWTEFHPNFFMSFQPGVLEDAPKTYLANVMISDLSKKAQLQSHLLTKFPDLNVIDIGQALSRGLTIALGILRPIKWTAILALLMSFFILFSVVSHNLSLRTHEIDVQKMMGADLALIRRLMVAEYVLTSSLAFSVGAIGAILIAYFVCVKILDVPLLLSWSALSLSALVVIVGSSLMANVAATRVLSRRGAFLMGGASK